MLLCRTYGWAGSTYGDLASSNSHIRLCLQLIYEQGLATVHPRHIRWIQGAEEFSCWTGVNLMRGQVLVYAEDEFPCGRWVSNLSYILIGASQGWI